MITPLYLASMATGPRLRLGVLIDGPTVPRYAAVVLEDIARSNFAAVELAILVRSASPTVAERVAGLAHELYLRVDRAIGGETDPLAPVDPGMGLVGVDRIEVSSGAAGEPWLPADTIAEIRRRELDVLLRFGTAVPRGEVLRAARYGVWSYRFDAGVDAGSGAPFFQLGEGGPTRDVVLEVLDDEPTAGLVLCRSSFGSRENLFLAPYRGVALWETTHFVVWKLHDLHELGWERVRERASAPARRAAKPGREEEASPPTTGAMVRFLAPRVGTAVVNRVRGERAAANQWKMALRRGAVPFGNTPEEISLDGFRWIDTPPGHFWADPFLIERGGQTWLLFEDFDGAQGYGTIRGLEVQGEGPVGAAVTCLDTGLHLSFPFVFEHDGEVFMIPESVADGTVTLYRARRFPSEWVREKVLFRGNAADTSVFPAGGRFYFFTTLYDRDDRGMKTMLFGADGLTGEWQLHPASPVSSDVRDARNAGAVLRRQGRLFRPTQNCGPSYGYGLNFQEITALDQDRYEERPWCAVDARALPFPAIGIHTYNVRGDLEVIDGCAKLAGQRGPAPW